MTQPLSAASSQPPFATGVDPFVFPPFINANRAPTINDVYNQGTRWQDNSVSNPIIYETTGAGRWFAGQANAATTTSLGTVFLATTAQTNSGGAPSASYVSSANDVAAALAAVVVGAGVPATIAQQGYVYLAQNSEVVSPYTEIHSNDALIPSNITPMFASPAPIGSTAPSTGAFTTLSTTNNATIGGTLGVTGASALAALSATTGTFSSTLNVTGTSTLAALNATTGTFSSTLGVSGTATMTTINATNGTFSGTLGVTGTTTIGMLSASNVTLSGTLGVTGLTTLAALTQLGAANINATGAGNTVIGQGTGTVSIGNTTGNTAITGALTTSGAQIITAGNLTLTNGNIVLTSSGNKINHTSVGTTTAAGANSIGSVTLVAGTATIATTSVTTNSLIKIWRQSIGATGAAALGELTVGTIVNGTSFVITAAQAASASSTQITDVSVVGWEIVN